jgi:dihydrofolate reductase
VNRILLHMMVSLDGFFEGPDRSLEWHRVDEELHQYFNDEMRDAGAFLGGRLNYELMDAFWPTADEGADVPTTIAEFAAIWRRVPKVVYSTTLDSVGDNATLVREVDPGAVRRLRDEVSGDLYVGGAILGRSFLELNLVDELRLYVNPAVIGAGRRLFEEGTPPLDLELLQTRTFTNGVVLLRYGMR